MIEFSWERARAHQQLGKSTFREHKSTQISDIKLLLTPSLWRFRVLFLFLAYWGNAIEWVSRPFPFHWSQPQPELQVLARQEGCLIYSQRLSGSRGWPPLKVSTTIIPAWFRDNVFRLRANFGKSNKFVNYNYNETSLPDSSFNLFHVKLAF